MLLYNAWGSHGAFLATATTKDPTTGPGGWTRYGPVFPEHAKLDGWPGKSGSIVSMPAPGPHYMIWSCATALRITPSIGRSMVRARCCRRVERWLRDCRCAFVAISTNPARAPPLSRPNIPSDPAYQVRLGVPLLRGLPVVRCDSKNKFQKKSSRVASPSAC